VTFRSGSWTLCRRPRSAAATAAVRARRPPQPAVAAHRHPSPKVATSVLSSRPVPTTRMTPGTPPTHPHMHTAIQRDVQSHTHTAMMTEQAHSHPEPWPGRGGRIAATRRAVRVASTTSTSTSRTRAPRAPTRSTSCRRSSTRGAGQTRPRKPRVPLWFSLCFGSSLKHKKERGGAAREGEGGVRAVPRSMRALALQMQ
jgi:hypothetical protein